MKSIDLYVSRTPDKGKMGLWLSDENFKQMPSSLIASTWWWLPPVIFPEDEAKWEKAIETVLKKGAKHFVLNAPWQMAFFSHPERLVLWAGPFCNIANSPAIETLASLNFSGVIASPELTREDYLQLPKHSVLPLGIVIFGDYPLCISRTVSNHLKLQRPFVSPKGEEAYIVEDNGSFRVYPNWRLDLTAQKDELANAGYRIFVYLNETLPDEITLKHRPGLWNWAHQLV